MEAPKGWERTGWIAVGAGVGAILGALLTAYGIHLWARGTELRVPRA